MSTLMNLQQAYINGLKTITGKSSRRVSRQKKTDEPPSVVRAFGLYDPSLGDKQAFPITKTMFFLSVVFWTAMSVLIYMGITYGLMYGRITQEEDLSEVCKDEFVSDKMKSADRVESYPMGEAGPYLIRLHSEKQEDFPMESSTLPPIVTGVMPSQFYEVQGLILHVNEDLKDKHSDLNLYVYDLGLDKRQRELLEKYCHCQIRDFQFDNFPTHVREVSNFAWRPIMLQLMLEEFGSVMYVDPMTRFKNPSSPSFLRRRGSKHYFMWDPMKFVSLIAYTEPNMFSYFNESRCAFKDSSLLSPEAITLYRTHNTWDEVMKPWLKCALTEACISPPKSLYSGCIEIRHPKTTGCHRYDMSALSIILNRGVQYTIDREKMVSFSLTQTEMENNKFFPEQPWTYTQILLLIASPVIIFILYKYLFKRRRFCR